MVLAQRVSLTSLSTCDGCACVWCLSGTHPPQAPIHPSALLVGDSFFMRRFPKSILCPLSKPAASVPGWIWPGAAQSWVRAELPFSKSSHPAVCQKGLSFKQSFRREGDQPGPNHFHVPEPNTGGRVFLQPCAKAVQRVQSWGPPKARPCTKLLAEVCSVSSLAV